MSRSPLPCPSDFRPDRPVSVARRRTIAALLAMLVAVPATGTGARAAKPGRRILLVVQQDGPSIAIDRQIRDHLVARGFSVTFADKRVGPGGAGAADLVIISSTVSAKDLDAGWRRIAVPLLTWENDVLDDLAMTGKRHDVDFGETEKERYLWVVNAPHPMAAGLPAGIANVYARQAPISWGRPGLGATIIATVYGQPEKVAIFGYEKGATMDYESLAPARRVMTFLDNETFANLSPAGIALFDAAVDWAIGIR